MRSIRNSLKMAFFGVFRVFAKKRRKKFKKNITFFLLIFRGLTRMSEKTCKKKLLGNLDCIRKPSTFALAFGNEGV